MELVIAGFFAFIISGIDDFTVLVMLFIIADNNIKKNFKIMLGTLLMMFIVIIISYYIGDMIKNYIWFLAILLIIYAIKNIYNNYKYSHDPNSKINKNSNLFYQSMWIFLINAGDDFAIYSMTFANIDNNLSSILFISGIIIGGITVIFIAYKTANIISNIEKIERKFESATLLNIPYFIMLIIGLLILFNSIN
ncbi:MAG: hypothetical protein U9Q66_00930 [Patescibacteria group bacterium]|nr:hypothetical protein [Patescibacteria group bacterium]